MQNTPNFGLRKPDYNEFADVMDLNYNADIIDTALENHQVDIDSYNQAILDLQKGTNDAIKKSLLDDYLNAVDKTLKVNKLPPEVQPSGNYSMTVQNNKDNPAEHGLFVGGRYADFSTKLLEVSVLFGTNGLGVYPAFVVDAARNTRVFGKLLINDSVDVESEINSLKSSVSSGKAQIASAITGKGVPTASDASFATMATNISNIGSNFSSGTIFSAGSGNFKLFGSSTTVVCPFVEITGLTFTPTLIIIRRVVGENIYETTYDSRAVSQRGFISSNTNSNNGTINNFSFNTLPAYINNTSFKAPVVTTGEYTYYIYG